jgi:hypothetical protein
VNYIKATGKRSIEIVDDTVESLPYKIGGIKGQSRRVSVILSRIESVEIKFDDSWTVQVDTLGGYQTFRYLNESDANAVYTAILAAVDAR